jgi:hypothetical protein
MIAQDDNRILMGCTFVHPCARQFELVVLLQQNSFFSSLKFEYEKDVSHEQ